jgi:hypothetical protein
MPVRRAKVRKRHQLLTTWSEKLGCRPARCQHSNKTRRQWRWATGDVRHSQAVYITSAVPRHHRLTDICQVLADPYFTRKRPVTATRVWLNSCRSRTVAEIGLTSNGTGAQPYYRKNTGRFHALVESQLQGWVYHIYEVGQRRLYCFKPILIIVSNHKVGDLTRSTVTPLNPCNAQRSTFFAVWHDMHE